MNFFADECVYPSTVAVLRSLHHSVENIKEAILLCLEDMQAHNQPIPDMSRILVSCVAVAL